MTNPPLMKRRNIRKAELLEICKRQGMYWLLDGHVVSDVKSQIAEFGRCECGCGEHFDLDSPPEYDHYIPNALLYSGDKIQWRVFRKSCHAKKTKADIKRIAKAKRQAGETGQYARRKKRGGSSIQSRGFNKTKTKKFNGEVVDRVT